MLNYTVDGPEDAPPLVLGSSLGTTTELWRAQLPELAARFRVVRYDHRGHGASPVPSGPYQLSDLGGDVLAVLDHLGLERAHVAGVSLGGMVGMWLAAAAPERVDRLALVCTSALLGPPEVWQERAAAVRAGGMAAVVDTVLARWFTPGFLAAHPDTVEWIRAMLASTPPEGYASCCAAIETMDLTPVLGRIAAPTLVVVGADDPATPREHGERIAAGIPGARLEVVPDAAHMAVVEQPAAVTGLLRDFFGVAG